MQAIAVVSKKTEWLKAIPGIEVVEARAYLTEDRYSDLAGIRVVTESD